MLFQLKHGEISKIAWEKMKSGMLESHKLVNGLGGKASCFLSVCFFIQICCANIMLIGSYFNPTTGDIYF